VRKFHCLHLATRGRRGDSFVPYLSERERKTNRKDDVRGRRLWKLPQPVERGRWSEADPRKCASGSGAPDRAVENQNHWLKPFLTLCPIHARRRTTNVMMMRQTSVLPTVSGHRNHSRSFCAAKCGACGFPGIVLPSWRLTSRRWHCFGSERAGVVGHPYRDIIMLPITEFSLEHSDSPEGSLDGAGTPHVQAFDD
jgi:hypothetical protein